MFLESELYNKIISFIFPFWINVKVIDLLIIISFIIIEFNWNKFKKKLYTFSMLSNFVCIKFSILC